MITTRILLIEFVKYVSCNYVFLAVIVMCDSQYLSSKFPIVNTGNFYDLTRNI